VFPAPFAIVFAFFFSRSLHCAVDGIGAVDRAPKEVIRRERAAAAAANEAAKGPKKQKKKMRGKNKMKKRMKKKADNVITAEREKLREAAEEAKKGTGGDGSGVGTQDINLDRSGRGRGGAKGLDDLALGRFSVKGGR
jgi:hypothetical protein